MRKNYLQSFINENKLNYWLNWYIVFFFIFYVCAYLSVTNMPPSSIPVHHDDYNNYAKTLNFEDFSFIRPVSTFVIQLLSSIDPLLLIWSIRFLTVLYVFQIFYISEKFFDLKLNSAVKILTTILIFSSPIIVEYARYTGMITHLTSGNLAVFAGIILYFSIVQNSCKILVFSILMMALSVLAKEDYILWYILLSMYMLFFKKIELSKRYLFILILGILFLSFLIIASKIFVSSSFLGVPDASSTYYVNVMPSSILGTMCSYLGGANHPSMYMHGQVIIISFLVALVLGIAFIKHNQGRTFALVLFAVSVLVPYSVLPNHVNAYYEMIWLPFIYLGLTSALLDLSNKLTVKIKIVIPILLVLVIVASYLDFFGRKSIASWYDTISASNQKVLDALQSSKSEINIKKIVCIDGADSFSPWYMHNGGYLENVMDIKSKWVIIPKTSDLIGGFKMAEQMSKNIQVAEKCDTNMTVLKFLNEH